MEWIRDIRTERSSFVLMSTMFQNAYLRKICKTAKKNSIHSDRMVYFFVIFVGQNSSPDRIRIDFFKKKLPGLIYISQYIVKFVK